MQSPYDRDSAMTALLRAMPYVRMYKEKVFVVKIGGALCGDPAGLRAMAQQLGVLRELGVRVVLVHGGGPQTTALAGKLGIETRFVAGRRVTDEATLDVAVMTLNGAASTAILAACRAESVPAVGVSGVAAGLVLAHRRPPVAREIEGLVESVDYGLVGDVVAVDPTVLESLLAEGFMPVVSPLSADEAGQVLNVNADTVASAVARAMLAEKLIFLTDTPGLLGNRDDPGSLVSYTDVKGLGRLEEAGAIDGGMLPKARAAVEALVAGVRRVHLVGHRTRFGLLAEIFTNEGAGTLVVRDTADLAPAEQAGTKTA